MLSCDVDFARLLGRHFCFALIEPNKAALWASVSVSVIVRSSVCQCRTFTPPDDGRFRSRTRRATNTNTGANAFGAATSHPSSAERESGNLRADDWNCEIEFGVGNGVGIEIEIERRVCEGSHCEMCSTHCVGPKSHWRKARYERAMRRRRRGSQKYSSTLHVRAPRGR